MPDPLNPGNMGSRTRNPEKGKPEEGQKRLGQKKPSLREHEN
jgi:hypothetical protein